MSSLTTERDELALKMQSSEVERRLIEVMRSFAGEGCGASLLSMLENAVTVEIRSMGGTPDEVIVTPDESGAKIIVGVIMEQDEAKIGVVISIETGL